MDWAAIATGTGVFAVVIFHIADHIRNHQKNERYEAEIRGSERTELQHIQAELEHPEHGLDALNRNLSQMREHCASITSQYSERLVNLEGNQRRKNMSSSS